MALLTKQDVVDGFTELGRLASAEGLMLELLLVGGGVMMLDLAARASTHDIDAVAMFPTESATVCRFHLWEQTRLNW